MNEHNLDLSMFNLDEIESIEFDKIDDCIDITVEDTHMFFANGIYTHNSGFDSEIIDVQSIGKAIEPFQVADVLISFSQTKTMAADNKCIALLLKNRLGKKGIALECFYDPNMCIFEEISVVNDMLLLSDKSKEMLKNMATSFRNKLNNGEFDKKK